MTNNSETDNLKIELKERLDQLSYEYFSVMADLRGCLDKASASLQTDVSREVMLATASLDILNSRTKIFCKEIIKYKKPRPEYLEIVTEGFERSSYKEGCLKRNLATLAHVASLDCRTQRIENIRKFEDRMAELELSFDQDLKKFNLRILKNGSLFDTVEAAMWDKHKIKRVIDDKDSKLRIPWKNILAGQAWTSFFRLNPYYLDELEIPNNVIDMRR